MTTIYLSPNTGSIDADLLRKEDTVLRKLSERGKTITIGDNINDSGMLSLDGLLLAACPENAHEEIKKLLKKRKNGYIAQRPVLDGFIDCLRETGRRAQRKGLSLHECTLFTDKDGVLQNKQDYTKGAIFKAMIRESGIIYPQTYIISGSSVKLNLNTGFMEAYGLTPENLYQNRTIRNNPFLLLLENGGIEINILNPNDRRYPAKEQFKEEIETLRGPVRDGIRSQMEEKIFKTFAGLHWVRNYEDQKTKRRGIYEVESETKFTLNIPYALRGTQEGEAFRMIVAEIIQEEAERQGFTVQQQ